MADNRAESGIWLVTGGYSGIGRELVRELIDSGSTVLVWDMREPDVEIRSQVDWATVDLTKTEAVAQAAKGVTRPVHCFVHCAGVAYQTTIDDPDSARSFRNALELHSVSLLQVVTLILPHLVEARGSIVAVTSLAAGIAYNAGDLVYAPSKAALQRLVEHLAVVLGPKGVRANCVAPGSIQTPMSITWSEPVPRAKRLQRLPLGRPGEPSDVTAAIRFLASPAAGFITGETIRVDGGMHLGHVASEARFNTTEGLQ
jgi:NAD(P)-dependent dehydrogenase (short-subunit alcohol dehydrogenase family)